MKYHGNRLSCVIRNPEGKLSNSNVMLELAPSFFRSAPLASTFSFSFAESTTARHRLPFVAHPGNHMALPGQILLRLIGRNEAMCEKRIF